MTTTEVAWDEDRQRQLDSTLACLSRLYDYDPAHAWDSECEGINNDLVTDRGVIPGVDEGSDEWRKAARVRSWWQFIRSDSGLSSVEAAGELGVATSTLNRWENGDRTPTEASRPRYQHWLTEKKNDLVEAYRETAIDLIAERDGWPGPPAGAEREALRDEFTRIGGFWDQWRRTGQIPNTRR